LYQPVTQQNENLEKVEPWLNHDFNIVSNENFNICVKTQDVSLLEILLSRELKELGYVSPTTRK
jgi:hypothetical protein